jgi:hypothetical protein
MPEEWLCTADVIVGQRVCKPGPTIRWQQMAREGRCALVYEIDDDLLDVDPSNGPAWSFFSRPEIRANVCRNVEVADLVTVSTEPLAEVMSKWNRNVVVLPNCVPQSLLDAPHTAGPKGLTFGWSGGMSHKLDLAEARDPVRQFLRRYPDAGLHVVGHVDPESARRCRKNGCTPLGGSTPCPPSTRRSTSTWPWPRCGRHRSTARSQPSDAWRLPLGIPVIASNFGPYAEFVQHGVTGLLVSRPHEWGKHLRALLDPVTRREMSRKARELAAGHTIEANIELWEKALT